MKKKELKNEMYEITLESFIDKCNENDIWYSLANKSLLSALTGINYYDKNDFLEIFMTYESYKKFLNLYPENVVDSINKNDYYFTNPFYFTNSSDVVIKIIILIPASTKKCENYYTLFNYKRQKIGFWISYNQKDYFFKRHFNKLRSKFISNITWNEIYSNIYDDKYNGYFLVDNLKLNINKNWIPSITFKSKTIKFLNTECSYIHEYDVFLTKRYGFEWNEKIKIKEDKFNFSWIKKIND